MVLFALDENTTLGGSLERTVWYIACNSTHLLIYFILPKAFYLDLCKTMIQINDLYGMQEYVNLLEVNKNLFHLILSCIMYRYQWTLRSTQATSVNVIRDAWQIWAHEFLGHKKIQWIIKPTISHRTIPSLTSAVHSNLIRNARMIRIASLENERFKKGSRDGYGSVVSYACFHIVAFPSKHEQND